MITKDEYLELLDWSATLPSGNVHTAFVNCYLHGMYAMFSNKSIDQIKQDLNELCGDGSKQP